MSKYYQRNMKRWELSPGDLFNAKVYCAGRAEDLIVWEASVASVPHDEKTRMLLVRHVADPAFSYMRMQTEGLTLSPEAFRVTRAKLYWYVFKFASQMGKFDHLGEQIDGVIISDGGES